MSDIAVKVSKLRDQIKDVRKVKELPKSTLDLILTGIEVELTEIQRDINSLDDTTAKSPEMVATKTTAPERSLAPTKEPTSSSRGGYGQNKK